MRNVSADKTKYFLKKTETVSAGKHIESFDVHKLTRELPAYVGVANDRKAKSCHANLEKTMFEIAVEKSGKTLGTSAVLGPGNCGTEGKTAVACHVCENNTLPSGTRSGT